MFAFDDPLHELLTIYGLASVCVGLPLGGAMRRRFEVSAAKATIGAVAACLAGLLVGGFLAFLAVAQASAASLMN